MSTQTQPATENALDKILELTREIVKRSGNGNCIYRGEPEHYDKVTSTLYRPSPSEFDSGKFNLEGLNDKNLENAQNHIRDNEKKDFELLTELQHYGFQTNLIDFTTDFHIALFFACNGSHDEDGRVIVLQRNKDIDEKYRVKQPVEPVNRVTAQKSIFTQPHKGFIDPNDFDTVTVPANLKQWILIYLRKFQDISIQSIYNDLHGFIRDHERRYSDEAMLPLALAEINLKHIMGNNPPAEEQKSAWREMIAGYTKRLEYSPYEVKLYVEQGKYYLYTEVYDCAIEAFCKAILLHPNYFEAYACRGLAFFRKKDYVGTIEDCAHVIQVYPDNAMLHIFRGIALLHQQDWEKAKVDFEDAKEMREDIPVFFHQDSQSVSDLNKSITLNYPQTLPKC